MLRRLAGVTGLFLLALGSVAYAQSQAQRTTNIRAAVVVIDSAQTGVAREPINYTPHVWFNLDSNHSVKPAGWNFYNPRANTQLTSAIWTRWNNIHTDLLGPLPLPNVGTRLGKDAAPYWEIRLSTVGESQLGDYDVLLVSAYGFTNLNSIERDKLRKFVDQGGLLWIDTGSSTDMTNVQVNTFSLPFRIITPGNQLLTDADNFSPLMTKPYSLSMANLEQIRTDRASFAAPLVMGGMWQIQSWLETDALMNSSVVATAGANPTIRIARQGAGFILLTTSKYAVALNRVPTGVGTYSNNNYFNAERPEFDRTTQLASKLIINFINMAGGYAQTGANSRKSNSHGIDLNPPLLQQVEVPNAIMRHQSPTLFKGLFVVSAGSEIRVYDANPKTDLDNNGNPDDGVPDLSQGFDYDLLWSANVGSTISSATCAEIPGSTPRDQVFVVNVSGQVFAYDAFALAGGIIQPSQGPAYVIDPPTTASFDPSAPGGGPHAPTFHDGLLYMSATATNGTGFVWIADPVNQEKVQTSGSLNWYAGADGATTVPSPSSSPTVGYIPIQDNSGGYDRVLYVPGKPSGVVGPSGTASITSMWLGARGESPPPNSVIINATDLTIITRAARQGLDIYVENGVGAGNYSARSLGVKLTMLRPTGDPYNDTDMATYFNGSVTQTNGQLVFPLSAPLPPNVTFRVDYSIDWGQDAVNHTQFSGMVNRGQLFLPDDYNIVPASDRRRIIGNIAMSPRGTIYVVSSTENPRTTRFDAGSFYAIREDIGRGGFRLLTRYNLYARHNITLNQAAPVSYPPALVDNDPLAGMAPGGILQGPFSHLTFVGAPSVRDGVVYVAASGRKPNTNIFLNENVPFTILMAFKAEPDPPEIRVGQIPDGFSLRQFDIDRSFDHTFPKAFNDMSQGQFTYDRNEGTIRFDNLMTANRGAMVNAFSTSQPVIIRRTNQPDQLIEPDAFGNKWSPLLWYSVWHGVDPTGGPVTTGSSVFLPGSSLIPDIDRLPAQFIFSGVIAAWNSNISPNSKWLQSPDTTRPWLRQLYQLISVPVTGIEPSPNFLWPAMSGIQDFDDYIVRVRQAKLGRNPLSSSRTAYGLIAGDNALGAWGDLGAYTFTKADIIVADEGRLGRYDAIGNPLWVSNTSTSTGKVDIGSTGTLSDMTRPVKAYPVGDSGDLIVADAGANQVRRVDLSGRELRTITGFKLDPTNVPSGYKANESLRLNSPRDVVLFTSYQMGGTQFWVHYLIADTGNKRLIEIVDKYNVNANRQITDAVMVGGERQIGVLHWHSPANYSGKSFDYNSVSRVYEPNSGRYFYAAGIGGAMPTTLNSGLDSSAPSTAARETVSGNGGIVIFDPTSPNNNLIINRVEMPAIPQNAFWNFSTGTFNSAARNGGIFKPMINVNSVTSRVVRSGAGSQIALMFTDATGVYEIVQPSAGADWVVRWFLPNEAFRAIKRFGNNPPSAQNAMDLRATYARRLDDGDVLIVNGYLGKTRGDGITPQAEYKGEVIQVNGDFNPALDRPGFDLNKPNLGFDSKMIVFQLPPIRGARGLVLPVFADRR